MAIVTLPTPYVYPTLFEGELGRIFSRPELAAEWLRNRAKPGSIKRIRDKEADWQTIPPGMITSEIQKGGIVKAITKEGVPLMIMQKLVWLE